MRIPLAAAVVLALGSCSTTRAAESLETVRLPGGPVDVHVHDRVGARVVAVEVERNGEAWTLSGTIHGAWLDTASRRTVRLDAFDPSGARISSEQRIARLVADAPRKSGVDAARFALAVFDPARVASFELSVVGD